jgi:hypothetical protein
VTTFKGISGSYGIVVVKIKNMAAKSIEKAYEYTKPLNLQYHRIALYNTHFLAEDTITTL